MYLKQNFASKGPGNRDQCKRPWDKDIFATFFFTFSWQNLVKPILFPLKLGMGCSFFHKYWAWDKGFLRGKIEMHRSQPLINLAWSLTTEQPVLRALSSQNVHLLTYPVKKKIQDVIWWNYIVNVHNFDRGHFSRCCFPKALCESRAS
jgi:hypothetical protein